MSDARTRELERLAAGGDPAARVALLRTRLRSGEQSQTRATIAAVLGDPTALAAVKLTESAGAVAREVRAWCWRSLRGSAHLVAGDQPKLARVYITACGTRVQGGRDALDGMERTTPTCRRCLASDSWRRLLRSAVGGLLHWVAMRDAECGFRACVAAIEVVLPTFLQTSRDTDVESLHTIAQLCAWVLAGRAGRPPAPRAAPQAWDPSGLFDTGLGAWAYGLACYCLEWRQGLTLGATARNIAMPLCDWARNTGGALQVTRDIRAMVCERVGPYALSDADPLEVYTAHLVEVVIPQAARA